jgi:hypothetical protein
MWSIKRGTTMIAQHKATTVHSSTRPKILIARRMIVLMSAARVFRLPERAKAALLLTVGSTTAL